MSHPKAFKRRSIGYSLFFLLSACGDVRLARMVQYSSQASEGEFCVAPPAVRTSYTKFMFVIDKSGSNNTTDPGAVKRAGSIEQFHAANRNNQYMKWGMITFQDPGTQARIRSGTEAVFVDGDDPQIPAAIAAVRTTDVGGTPYGAALAMTKAAIEKDIRDHADEDNMYMVFFVSDGAPTDVTAESALRAAVNSIIRLKPPGRIALSTGYYNAGATADPVAIARLQAMAEEGGGKFVNFRDTSVFDFNELITPGPVRQPWQIKNSLFLVYNINSAICSDNAYGMDSDSDGVCDMDEHAYTVNGQTITLDPTNRYSQPTLFPSYGDYFVWRYIMYGTSLNPCMDPNPLADPDHDLLNNCEERALYNGSPTPGIPNFASKTNPDTDLDGFLDGIEALVFKTSVSYAMNSYNMMNTFDFEPMNAGMQVKQHRNPMAYDPNAFAYDTNIVPTRINTLGQTCYSFAQNNLQLYQTRGVAPTNVLADHEHAAGENVVLLYYIQTPQNDPDSKGVLQYSYQKLSFSGAQANGHATGAGLKLNQFRAYEVP